MEISYWSAILARGWAGSVFLGMRARRHDHSQLPPAMLATVIALPGGITFTLYFIFALLAGTFDAYTMWAVAAAQFGSWVFALGALSRQSLLTWSGIAWFALFAAGTIMEPTNRWLELAMVLGCGLGLALPGYQLLRTEADHLNKIIPPEREEKTHAI